jgi:hypothetical protein
MAGMEVNVCAWIAEATAKSMAAAMQQEASLTRIVLAFECGVKKTVYVAKLNSANCLRRTNTRFPKRDPSEKGLGSVQVFIAKYGIWNYKRKLDDGGQGKTSP